MIKVMEKVENEKIINALYSQRKHLDFSNVSSWLNEAGNFEKFISFVSKFTQLEIVVLNFLEMDGVMIARAIAALAPSLNTIKEFRSWNVNWDTDEALTQLLQFIANAPKLQVCVISGQRNFKKFRIERQKSSNNCRGFVRAASQITGSVLYEVETPLDTDIEIDY